MAIKILRIDEVIAVTGMSRSGIYAAVKKGAFPRPYALTQRTVGWVEDEVQSWLSSKLADARPQAQGDAS